MRFQVEVVNLRNGNAGVFRCDRRSPLGNPHVMHDQSDEERNRVCDAFERDFCPNPEQLDYLRTIWRSGMRCGSVRIGCHCAPSRCHCDIIKSWLESHMTDSP